MATHIAYPVILKICFSYQQPDFEKEIECNMRRSVPPVTKIFLPYSKSYLSDISSNECGISDFLLEVYSSSPLLQNILI